MKNFFKFLDENKRYIGGFLALVALILIAVFVLPMIIPVQADAISKPDEEFKLTGAKLSTTASAITGGKSVEGYMYREHYTPDQISELNKTVHVTLLFTPPPENMEKLEYLKIKRTLPDDTVVEYTINNPYPNADQRPGDSSSATYLSRTGDFITVHASGTEGVAILEDEEAGRVDLTTVFVEGSEASQSQELKIVLWGDSCGENSQVSDEKENVFELFYKIDKSWYSTAIKTMEAPILDEDQNDLKGSLKMNEDIYEADMNLNQETMLDLVLGGFGALDTDFLQSSIINENNKFHMGLKVQGKGSLIKNRFLLFDPNANNFKTRSIFNDIAQNHKVLYFSDNKTPTLNFHDIRNDDELNAIVFKIKFTYPRDNTRVHYFTHSVDSGTNKDTYDLKLEATENEAEAKDFILIETTGDTTGEGSFKLCLRDGYEQTGRWQVVLDPNIDVDNANEGNTNVLIRHTSDMFPSRFQYCVYCPILTDEVINPSGSNEEYAIFVMENGPGTSTKINMFDSDSSNCWSDNIQVQDDDKVNDTISNMTVNEMKFFRFENVGGDEYKMSTSDQKYLQHNIDTNNNLPFIDPVINWASGRKFKRDENTAKIKIIGYPTTAALKYLNKQDISESDTFHVMILFRNGDSDPYAPFYYPPDDDLDDNMKKGGRGIQCIIKKKS